MANYGVLMRNGVNYSHDTAESISYNNSTSGLSATNVQSAVDELKDKLFRIGEEYVVVDRTSASSGIASDTTIQLDATATAIVQSLKFVTVLCFTNRASYTSGTAVYMVIDRFGGHYFAAFGTNASNYTAGCIRLNRVDDRNDQLVWEKYGFPSSYVLYLQKLILIPQ